MALVPEFHCEACRLPATNKCGGCSSDTYTHAYCSLECQKKDWPKHKLVCKDLDLDKQLQRVARIVHEAYLNFREDTWDTSINRVKATSTEIITYDGDQQKNTRFFVKFPDEMVSDEETRSALLTSWICNEPLAFMFNLLKKLMKVTLEEITVSLNPPPLKTTYVMPNGQRNSNYPASFHELFRITSIKIGQQWVLDIAGGQYGIYPEGTNKALISRLGTIEGNPSLTYGLVEEAANVLDAAVETWEGEFLQLAELRDLDLGDFERRTTSLYEIMRKTVGDFVECGAYMPKVRAAKAYEVAHPGVSQQRCLAGSK